MDIDIAILVCLIIALAVPIVLFLLWVFFAVSRYFMEKIRMWMLRKKYEKWGEKSSENGIKMKRIKLKNRRGG